MPIWAVPKFYMAEREGFETAHTISSRAPSASSDISPKILRQALILLRYHGMAEQVGFECTFCAIQHV